jgi:tRNA A-37 threonylcarbamoyl transferase component Bud32/HAMP domain-containing protein
MVDNAVATEVRGGSPLPLAWRIFLLCGLLVLLAVAAAVAATWFVGQRIAAEAVDEALARSAEEQSSQTQQRLRLLERTLLLIGRDPALVTYVAASLGGDELGLGDSSGPDMASVRDLLIERREQFGFDLGLVLDANGELLARSDESEAFAENLADDPLVAAAIDRRSPQSGFWRMGDALYQAAILPLAQDETLVGFLLLAQRVDDALSQDIARASEAEIAFWLPNEGGIGLAASSLPEDRGKALAAAVASRPEVVEAVRLGQPIDRLDFDFGGQHWLVRIQPTAVEGATELGAVSALASGDAVVSGYRQILDHVLLAGLASLAIALLLSFWLSRRILKPARVLAEAAEQAAAGNYQTEVAIRGNDELARLGRAIDSLLSDLREKRDIEGYVANFSRFVPDAGESGGAEIEPQRPRPPAPAGWRGWLLGAEFAPSDNEGDAVMRFARLQSLATEMPILVQSCGGRILAGNGQRWVLGFEGEQAALRALQAANALMHEVRIEGLRPPSLALLEGEGAVGTLMLDEREMPALFGAGAFQVERLLGESAPGRALLTRGAGDAIKAVHGTELLNVAEGSASGKRYYSLNAAALGGLAFPEPAPVEASQATRVSAAATGSAMGEYRPGTRLGGRYEILAQLGEGGMGVVYKARDLELRDIVALKMLRPGALQDREQLDRLKDEIRLARKITHPNVLRTFDFGEIGGTPFISMEFVRGVTLRGLLSESGRLPYSAGLRIARQFCAGLAAAHEVGVVHRDIKPENLILEVGGNVKLMDFGIARPERRANPGLTQPGMYIGTPSYSAPEQLAGEDVDARADLYSAGVMLSEMFCGGLPYGGQTTMEIYRQQLHEEPVRPSLLWPEIPVALEEIILRCIARQREARYQSAAELGADLAQLRA